MHTTPPIFAPRGDTAEVEQGLTLSPRFDDDGLIPAIASDADTGEVLMLAYMNAQALAQTIESREAWFYSRSRKKMWKKGEQSGHVLQVRQLLVDCDQDCVWMRVKVAGDSGACHVGYRSCFYRDVPLGPSSHQGPLPLRQTLDHKLFDPRSVYGQGTPKA
jgi:phosphoribosyl-AMP cyclohydrolase